ncbi:MAG TPA: SapC family protein [Allosphingosinicella sp.]|nr:SapC family protein [Allosphingosinicella sp.]
MAEQLELLNSDAHGQLRMRVDPGEPHPHFAMIVLSEFSAASGTCPIFLAKDPTTGEFYAAALFGFEPGELLVEGAAEGKAPFQPLDLQRRGFFAADENIAIDIAHPRFDSRATLALFEEDGTPSNALRRIQKVIGELAGGIEATRAFVRELLRLKLVEPIDISLRFDDGTQLSLDGLYTVSRDALNGLSDDDVVALFRSGSLQAALCMSLSLNQIPMLARRRNERLTA